MKKPLPLPGGKLVFPEHPSPLRFVEMARQNDGVCIDIEKPFWWDTPVWLASGQINSIGLANNHMCHSRMFETKAWGSPATKSDCHRREPMDSGRKNFTIMCSITSWACPLPPEAHRACCRIPWATIAFMSTWTLTSLMMLGGKAEKPGDRSSPTNSCCYAMRTTICPVMCCRTTGR